MPYLLALLSIIILLPFLLYLNLGITKKGKLVIVALSLLMSVLGILAQMNYPLWQIVLIILLLGFFLTYLLINRFQSLIFQNNNVNEQNKYTEENFEYRNTILILEEEDEETEHSTNIKNSIVNENNQDMIDNLNRSLHDQTENNSTAIDFTETSNLDDNETSILEEMKDDELLGQISQPQYIEYHSDSIEEIFLVEEDLSDTIEEIIKEGEEQADSQKNVNQIVNDDFEVPDAIIPILKEELSQGGKLNELFPIGDFGDEIEEIESIIFSSKAIEKTEEIELIDFDEDEIVPIKEFRPTPKEEDIKFKNEQSVKKENYLSEIEKLLEED